MDVFSYNFIFRTFLLTYKHDRVDRQKYFDPCTKGKGLNPITVSIEKTIYNSSAQLHFPLDSPVSRDVYLSGYIVPKQDKIAVARMNEKSTMAQINSCFFFFSLFLRVRVLQWGERERERGRTHTAALFLSFRLLMASQPPNWRTTQSFALKLVAGCAAARRDREITFARASRSHSIFHMRVGIHAAQLGVIRAITTCMYIVGLAVGSDLYFLYIKRVREISGEPLCGYRI